MLRIALCTLWLWWGLAAAAQAQGVRVSMSASSNRVAVGEPFAIEIRIESSGEDTDEIQLPDFDDFEVLGRSTSRPFSFSFGFGSGGGRARVKSEIVYAFTLRAVKVGAHTIRPAIVSAGGRRIASQPLSIMVLEPSRVDPLAGPNTGSNPAQADQAPAARDGTQAPPPSGALDGAVYDPTMFLRTSVDKQRAYVGEQVTVTVYLYLRGQIGDSPSITREPTLEGFWSYDLLPLQRSLSAHRQDVQGRPYNVYVLRRFAAFPLRPGTLEVGAPAVEVGAGGSIFDLLNGPSRPLHRDGVKVSVEALPLPAHPTASAPVHTGSLALEAALDPPSAKVGDAVTLRVTAKGRGHLRGLTLPAPQIQGLEVLPPELEDKTSHEQDQIGGERVFRWLLLPRTQGSYAIPSFAVDVFDPVSGQFSSERTQALTLKVKGEAAAAAAPPSEPAPEELATRRFGPARLDSALRRQRPALAERGFFWPSVLGAPALLIAVFAVQLARRRLAQRRAAGRAGQSAREVEAKLEQAARAAANRDANGTLSLLASALKRTLEAQLGEPVGGMTMPALEAELSRRGLDPKLSTRVTAQLGALESARFDPAAQGALELNKALDGVRALVRELERTRFRPPSAPARERRRELA